MDTSPFERWDVYNAYSEEFSGFMDASTIGWRVYILSLIHISTPSSTPEPAANYTLQGQGHQSEIGWLSSVGDGQTIGNDTNNKNLEAAKLIIENALEADLRIVGDAHVSGIGWINNQEAGKDVYKRQILCIWIFS